MAGREAVLFWPDRVRGSGHWGGGSCRQCYCSYRPAEHRILGGTIGEQLDLEAIAGIPVGQVQVAGPQVPGLQVGGYPLAAEHRVVSMQQRGANSLGLPVRRTARIAR